MKVVLGVLLLLIRGLALWIVVPVVVVGWIVSYPLLALLGQRAHLRQAVGGADLNLIAALQRCLPWALVGEPQSFVG